MSSYLDQRDLLNGTIPVSPLTAEASARRYSRPVGSRGQGWLLVESPTPPPVETTEWLMECGVRVPELGKIKAGQYLVEDLGAEQLCSQPSLTAYQSLWRAWESFAHIPIPPRLENSSLTLDASLFANELEIFKSSWILGLRAGSLTQAEAHELETACISLAKEAAKGPLCVQHRDFHSRNILRINDGLAFLDHQDMRTGPLFYDLGSLLTDAYVDLSKEVISFLEERFEILGRRYRLSPEEASHRLHASSLQRVLKVLGTFGKLISEGREEYTEPEARARKHAIRLLGNSPFKVFSTWVLPQ